jgi:hypothetical protein
MTHPLRDPKGNGQKRKVKHGEPFDPEELTRRLTAHLIEQKAKQERRREARAAKAATAQQDTVYHHVPKVAATAFERTTTPDAMRQVHKLAQSAIKAHLEQLTIDDPLPGVPVTSLKKTQAMDQAMIERDLLRNRNQFQWDQAMEEAAEADVYRDVYKPPQRTFIDEFAHLRGGHVQKNTRPLSTGDVFSEDDDAHATTKTKPKPKPAGYDGNDRHDWAQRDDEAESGRKKEGPTLFLRKKESSWILLGKKSPKSPKQDKDDGTAAIGDFGSSPPDGNKSGKARFLARFKRHPS